VLEFLGFDSDGRSAARQWDGRSADVSHPGRLAEVWVNEILKTQNLQVPDLSRLKKQ